MYYAEDLATMPQAVLPSLVPDVRLHGCVDAHMLSEFLRQQREVLPDKQLIFEISTEGGAADIGRRIAQEIKLWQSVEGRELFFFGKSNVSSAGITIMSAFPKNHRFVTADTMLLVHERKLKKTLELDGSLRACKSLVNDLLAEIESGQALQRKGFEDLVYGSHMTIEDLEAKVMEKQWFLTAQEALALGLIEGVV